MVAEIPAEQQAHRIALGQAIGTWMRMQGWSQQVPHEWGVEMAGEGKQSSGPHNSQISLLQRGRLDGKPGVFIALGAFNAAVAAQDLIQIKGRSLRDRLTGAEAFLLEDGKPARASDFFAMFVGELEIPSRYAVSNQPLSDEEVKALNEKLRTDFKAGAQNRMLTPAEAWPVLWKQMALPTRLSGKLREVLSGWAEFSADELGDGLVAASLRGWAKNG